MFSSDYIFNFLKCQSDSEDPHIVEDPINLPVNKFLNVRI